MQTQLTSAGRQRCCSVHRIMAFSQALAMHSGGGHASGHWTSSRRAPQPFTCSLQPVQAQRASLLGNPAGVQAPAANVRPSHCSSGHSSARQRTAAGRLAASAVDVALNHTELPDGSVSVVLLAGGVGKRMGAAIPKQYLPLRGKPIATYSLVTFANMREVGEVVIVCDPSWRHIFEAVLPSLPPCVAIKWARPGKERQDSVSNGLDAASADAAVVAVHDSARPLVTAADAARCMNDGSSVGAAVLGVPVKPTIKEVDGDMMVIKTLQRSKLWEVQTPQCIRPALLREGFALVGSQGLEVTDDVSIIEAMGRPVLITPGSYTNIKVTTPDDMSIAEKFLDELKTVEAAAAAAATATAAPASAASAA